MPMNKNEEVEKGGEEVEKKKRRWRRVIYKLGEVIEICKKQNGRGEEGEGKAGSIKERIPIAFFTLVFGSLRQRELEDGIIS